MRLLPLIPILTTLILAAPASAANIAHSGPNVDFTVQPGRQRGPHGHRHALGDTTGATFTRAPGATPLTITGGGCSININTNIAHCGVGPGGAFRFTTANLADRIDASGTQLPFDESAPEQFNSAGGDD